MIADPWAPGALDGIAPDAAVLIAGTGLTMADTVAALARRHHTGLILAVSRRGLLSRGHVFGDTPRRNHFETSPPCATALALCRAVRAQVRDAAAGGQPWQAVFDDVRANARRLWADLDDAQRRRVVRHLRPFWDVHRFRVAPQAEAAIATLRQAGQFRSLAARLVGATWDGSTITVQLRARRSSMPITVAAGAVVVTTGPDHTGALAANPVLASLAECGLIRPDGAGLGLAVDDASRAIGVDHTARPTLLVAGPLARGHFGELMGLPQVSEHARAVAGTAAAALRLVPPPAQGSA